MKILKLIVMILTRIVIISLVLVLFFSMMAGMYYKTAPRNIRIAIVDEDHSSLSRSILYNIQATDYYQIVAQPADYLSLQKMIDRNEIDMGIIIPHDAYRDLLNNTEVRLMAALNGTANPSIPGSALSKLNQIIMTLNGQLAMHIRVEDLGGIPNIRHSKGPMLSVSERVYYSPSLSMEASVLPAFMGLAMQTISMLTVLFALLGSLKTWKQKFPFINNARQIPIKDLIRAAIVSCIVAGTSISIAFFTTMHLFGVPFEPMGMWNVIKVIFLFTLAMESISYLLVLNINNSSILAAIITLIVLPAFMYSGYMVPFEQMADLPNKIGGWFPLRYYLKALYLVFNHHQPLTAAQPFLNKLWNFSGLFFSLSAISIIIGQIERKHRMKKHNIENNKLNIQEIQS
jgi:ABC-2 type transport system permease protein